MFACPRHNLHAGVGSRRVGCASPAGRFRCANPSSSSLLSLYTASSLARPGPQRSASAERTLSRRSRRPAAPWAAISLQTRAVGTDALTHAQVAPPLALLHAPAAVTAPVSALAAVNACVLDLLCPVSLEGMRLRGC